MRRSLQTVHARTEGRQHVGDVLEKPCERFGPWLTSREACLYVPCPSLGAWYQWRRRHGIVPRRNGSVARADLDRALKGQRRIAAASLANLNRKAS